MNVIFSKGAKNLSKNLIEKAAIINGKIGQTALNEAIQVNKKIISENFKINTFKQQAFKPTEFQNGIVAKLNAEKVMSLNKNQMKNIKQFNTFQASQNANKFAAFSQVNKIISQKNISVLTQEKKQFLSAAASRLTISQKQALNSLASKLKSQWSSNANKMIGVLGVNSAFAANSLQFQKETAQLIYAQGETPAQDDDTTVIRYRQSKDPFETFTNQVEKIVSVPVNQDWSIKTQTPGDGQNYPNVGDTVTIHWTLRLKDGEIYDSSANMNRGPYSFIVGNADVIEPWEYGIQKMSLGEKALISYPKQLQGVNNLRKMPSYVPTHEDKYYEIELIDIQRKKK